MASAERAPMSPLGPIATDRCAPKIAPCPLFPESDEKSGLTETKGRRGTALTWGKSRTAKGRCRVWNRCVAARCSRRCASFVKIPRRRLGCGTAARSYIQASVAARLDRAIIRSGKLIEPKAIEPAQAE